MGIVVAGDYVSSVVILPLARAQVERMLPSELELMPQTVTPPDTHPVMLSFNNQHHVRLQWGWLKGPQFDYLEFAVGVPFTKLKKNPGAYAGPFFFAPVLYLNELIAILMGMLWGFAKHDATIASSPQTFSITTQNKPPVPILQADFQLRGAPGKLSDFPNARGLTGILNQPGIGKTVFGPMLSFGLEQNLDGAVVQAMDADIQIAQPFLQGLAPGTYTAKGLDQVPLGAYRMTTNWWLDPPMPPSWLKPKKAQK